MLLSPFRWGSWESLLEHKGRNGEQEFEEEGEKGNSPCDRDQNLWDVVLTIRPWISICIPKKIKNKKIRKFPVLKLSLNPSNQHCLTTNGYHQVFSYQFVKMLASNSSTSSQSIHCTWTVVRVCKLVGHSSCWLVTPF